MPKGMDPATITLDQAVGLIAAKAEKGPGKPKRRNTGSPKVTKATKTKRAKAKAEPDQD